MMDDNEKRRREWFRYYITRIEQGVILAPLSGMMYSCPCCAYPTLSERGSYNICPLCNWEDDGQDDPNAYEVWGSPNGTYSLAEARENFKKNMIMYDSIDPRIGGGDSPLEKKAKKLMMEAFDQMLDETNPKTLNTLWEKVNENREILYKEVKRKVHEYEEQHKK